VSGDCKRKREARSVPEGDLVLGALGTIRAVDDVAANVNAEVTPDGASLSISGVGGTNDLAAVDDGVPALPDLKGKRVRQFSERAGTRAVRIE
jgi:hypothetical protein